VDASQVLFARFRVPLVVAALGAAVADVVLGGGEHILALQAGDVAGHRGRDLGVLAERLVRAAPAVVAGHAEAGREVPVQAGGGDLVGRGPPDLLHQGRVAGRAEADVVRKDRGAADVVVPVHRVYAVDDRYLQRAFEGGALERVVHVRPALGFGVGWSRPATGQHRPDPVLGEDLGVARDGRAVDLRHLPYLVREAHPAQQVVDALRDGAGGVSVGQVVCGAVVPAVVPAGGHGDGDRGDDNGRDGPDEHFPHGHGY
jgi:hypothetical protein